MTRFNTRKGPDKEKVKNYENSLTFYKTLKAPLKKIVKDEKVYKSINEIVYATNKIVIHTYQFLKLYVLDSYEINEYIPDINEILLINIMKTLCQSTETRGSKPKEETIKLRKNLSDFYEKVYKKTLFVEEDLYMSSMDQIFKYESKDMIKNIQNHICLHFFDMVNRFINLVAGKKIKEEVIHNNKSLDKETRKNKIHELRNELKVLKRDILNGTDKCDKKYNKIKSKLRDFIDFDMDGKDKPLTYYVKENPFSFLVPLIKMSIDGEKEFRKQLPKEQKKDTFSSVNCFPLRSNLRPKYTTIDTEIILNMLMEKSGRYRGEGKSISKLSDQIWDTFFYTEKKCFKKKGYHFNRQISTDGIGCSILLIREDKFNPFGKSKIKIPSKPPGYKSEEYIEDLDEKTKMNLRGLEVIGIDPGKCDLIYATNGDTKKVDKENGYSVHKTTHLRYSQNQKCVESRSRKYTKIRENDKKETEINKKSIKEIESVLSNYTTKTCIYKNVVSYVKTKNKVNYLIQNYYQKPMYRKLKFNRFINDKRSEDKFMNRFESLFGKPDKSMIIFGDFEQKQHMKFKEPTKGKSLRRMFKKRGYKLYLVDEFRTTCRSFINGEEMETFLKVRNPRPDKENKKKKKVEKIICRGLIRSKIYPNIKDSTIKRTLINRDLNGALNIRFKGICYLYNLKVPDHLLRSQVKE